MARRFAREVAGVFRDAMARQKNPEAYRLEASDVVKRPADYKVSLGLQGEGVFSGADLQVLRNAFEALLARRERRAEAGRGQGVSVLRERLDGPNLHGVRFHFYSKNRAALKRLRALFLRETRLSVIR